MSRYYILKDKTPIEVTGVQEWAAEYEYGNSSVARDTFGNTLVSTVFLGIDHSWDGEEPMLFETMIFGGKHDQYQTRCSTWDEAIIQHEEACKLVRNKFMSWMKRILNL